MNTFSLSKDISLSELDKSRNILITGMPGVGISAYFLQLMRQDIHNATPIVLFDQYGDLCDGILSALDENTLQKTAYIDIGNTEYPVGINIFEENDDYGKQEISNLFINLMYDLYDPNKTGIIGPRFEHAVRNAITTILYAEKASFIELLRCLTDSSYVSDLLPSVKDPVLVSYWHKQMAQTSDFHKSEVLDYIISKLSILVTDRKMRNIVAQTKSSINFDSLLTDNNVILFNFGGLNKFQDANEVISTFLMFKLTQELRKRSKDQETRLSMYIDDATSWPSAAIQELFAENRRYNMDLIVSSDKIHQASPELSSTLRTTGTLVSFRVFTDDAKVIAPEFHNQNISVDKLCLLQKYYAYIKTLEDGNVIVKEEPVKIELDTPETRDSINVETFKANAGKKFGVDAKIVEEDIKNRLK